MRKAGCPAEDLERAVVGDPPEASASELLNQRDQVDEAIFSLRDAVAPEQLKAAVLLLIPLADAGHPDAAVELARTYDRAAESGDEAAKENARHWRCEAYRLGSSEF